MAAFFRGLLLFLFGAIVGAGGILFFTPSFNIVVSRHEAAPAAPAFAPSPAKAAVAVATKPAETSAAAKPAVASTPAPLPAAPAVAPAAATIEPAIDFKAIAQHLILWPASVTVKTATTVPVLVDGKKTQDLALEAGTVLQVSQVLADGSLEVRAKGAKFEIKSTLTDFSAELGKRVAELVAKGTKFDSPFPAAPAAPVAATAPAAVPAAATPAPVVAVVVAKVPLTLAQRVDLLYGIKPEPETPVAPAAPASVTPAAVAPAAVAPAPAATPPAAVVPSAPADQKADEKGKDLDRKMNQLFK
jgi:hypothetical protein